MAMGMHAIRLLAVVVLVLAGILNGPPRGFAQPADFDISNGHFYSQTGGDTGRPGSTADRRTRSARVTGR